MLQSFQEGPRIKILPALIFEGSLGLRETDRNEITKTAEGLLPRVEFRSPLWQGPQSLGQLARAREAVLWLAADATGDVLAQHWIRHVFHPFARERMIETSRDQLVEHHPKRIEVRPRGRRLAHQ